MTLCPAGHDSAHDDYCDECGAAMGGAAPQSPVSSPGAPDPAPVAGRVCPVCDEVQHDPTDRYCESCGHDVTRPATVPPDAAPAVAAVPSPAPAPAAGGWTAVVEVDRAWYDDVRAESGPDVAALEFPGHYPERRFELTGPRLVIGRRSRTRGTNPDIDLAGPPMDPGVSSMHAVLVERPDGGWEVVDLDSANGTRVGADRAPIAAHRPVPLRSGDRIRLGAWTTITVTAPAG